MVEAFIELGHEGLVVRIAEGFVVSDIAEILERPSGVALSRA